MGLRIYKCSEQFAQEVPGLLAQHGFRVDTAERHDLLHAYRIRRGLGTVRFHAPIKRPSLSICIFTLTCGGNPLLWLFHGVLLARVRRVLLSSGAAYWDPRGELRVS